MRRFLLTYEEENQATDIEGIQFTSGKAALDRHPHGGVASFRSIGRMEHELNELGKASIKWLDEEVSL